MTKEFNNKIALVLTGAPRAVSHEEWQKRVPECHSSTDASEVHIFVCAMEYDSTDRYLLGEDPTLAGLDTEPYIDYTSSDKRTRASKIIDRILYKRNEHGHIAEAKMPLNKSKWEEYHRKHWAWADSITFVYWSMEEVNKFVLEMTEHHRARGNPNCPYRLPQWHNQYLLYVKAYHQNKEFFDSLTPEDLIVRKRYDIGMINNHNLNAFSRVMRIDPRGFGTGEGIQLSPRVLVNSFKCIRGKLIADDAWNAWDGPGAQIFGQDYINYLKQNWRHWLAGHVVQKIDLGRDGIDWDKPETSLPQFSFQHNYTINHVPGRQSLGTELFSIQSNHNQIPGPAPVTDQWRYAWYDWTEEMVQEIREQCS